MSHWRLHPTQPIFAVKGGAVSAVYVPGRIMPASDGLLEALSSLWREDGGPGSFSPARSLIQAAEAAQAAWRNFRTGPKEPLCLNVQLPYACNQNCEYCYTRVVSRRYQSEGTLPREAIAAAARLVAGNCARRRTPFQVDIQGLGEPTVRWDDLLWCVETTQAIATAAGVPWSGHLSTNGQTDAERAAWIGKAFPHVTVSCDGPPDIQDRLRPRSDGRPSSAGLPGCVAAMARGGATLEARVTVTAANCRRLPEVVRYIAAELGISRIRLEPVFAASAAAALPAPQFVAAACLHASDAGAAAGAEVSLAAPCLTELHGEFCQVLRQTLRIMPDGLALNCLHGACPDRSWAATVGHYDPTAGEFVLDPVWQSPADLFVVDDAGPCASCLNIYHCTRSCPDRCPVAASPERAWRCLFQQSLAEAWILRAAGETSPDPAGGPAGILDRQLMDELEREVEQVPAPSDRRRIVTDTLKAASEYPLDRQAMPAPAWADDAACLPSAGAADILLEEARRRTNPISVYVHIPFCRKRCVFCDCHSLPLGRDAAARSAAYMALLERDLEQWCREGGMGLRPVTTVHFGGGTPNAIEPALMSDWIVTLRGRLAVGERTQWAVETTSEDSEPQQVERLLALGFRRLHVGVQTLRDDLRRRLGRSSLAVSVVSRLRLAMEMGMVVSVDMLYGLPGQKAGELVRDVERLIEAGIHGVSLYRLNFPPQRRRFLREFPGFEPCPLRACVMLQAAERVLLRAGYRKNHFVHYAQPEDDNCYYRHAVRDEDLLGLGASASGNIGPWEYRCSFYVQYVQHADRRLPIASLARSPSPPLLARFAAALMAGTVEVASVPRQPLVVRLVERWLRAGLLVAEAEQLRVTAMGAWLLAAMLRELAGIGKSKDTS